MTDARPFTISRDLDAPRELVYQACTDVAHLARWMGPQGAKVIHAAMDLRVGGTYHYAMELPGGLRMWGKQVFRELQPPERLVYVQSFSDEAGGLTRHPLSAAWPLQMLSTVTFADLGGRRTRMTISWVPYEPDEAGLAAFDAARGSMEQGFTGQFVNLEAHLAATAPRARGFDLRFERLIAAPRERVFEAWSRPEHVRRWFTPAPLGTGECSLDFRPGGAWVHAMLLPDGHASVMRARYREIAPLERIVFEATLDDLPGARIVTTVTFAEEGAGTRLAARQELFDGDVPEGDARAGWALTLAQLAEVAAQLA